MCSCAKQSRTHTKSEKRRTTQNSVLVNTGMVDCKHGGHAVCGPSGECGEGIHAMPRTIGAIHTEERAP